MNTELEKSGMLALILWTVLFLITGFTLNARGQESEPVPDEQVLEEYIFWFMSNVRPALGRKALEVIPIVIKYSLIYEVDPLLVACIISLESSWRPRDGKGGERGYMQVMPSKWSRRYNLDTQDGQLEAGVARLRSAFEACAWDLRGALTHYASGVCKPRTETTRKKMKYRVNYFRRIEKKFRGE